MKTVETEVNILEVVNNKHTLPETNRIKVLIKTLRKNKRNKDYVNPSVLNLLISSTEDINLVKILISLRLVKVINLRFINQELQDKAMDILLIRDIKLDVHLRQYMISMSLNRIHSKNPNASINNDVVKALQHEYIMGFVTCIDYLNQSETSCIPVDILKKIKNNQIITE